MEIKELIVNISDKRVDSFIAGELEELSRSYIQKIIKKGLVKVNDKKIKSNYIVNDGDKILIQFPEPENLEVEPQDIPISIIYEDDYVAIVNKPQGMVVHPAPGNYDNTLVNALLFKLKDLSTINGVIRPGIVHRIDKDTSGLLMIAKTDKAHIELSRQLKEHSIYRRYFTIVHGNIKEDTGTIDEPIGRHPIHRKKMAVTYKNSKKAITHFKVLERFKKYSLLEVKLETGRTHQIRVHMSHIKHPVLGDPVYSSGKSEFNLNGQLLHAKSVGFIHPISGQYMEFDSELPEHFNKVLNILKKRI